MRLWLRRWMCSIRLVSGKSVSLLQNMAKCAARTTVDLLQSEAARFTCIVVTFAIICCSFFLWLYVRDPCFQWEIRQKLCEDYSQGLVAGTLCYDLCVERSVSMSNCINQEDDIMTFFGSGLVYKVQRNQQTFSSHGPSPNAVWEGMTNKELSSLLYDFFTAHLGRVDHSNLVDRTIQFSDFNQDGKLSFAEVQSLWQLLQVREFHILFLFQGSSIFPSLNSSCGRLYSYQMVENPILYDRTTDSIWDKVISNRYRWGLPEWPKRVHIALGLLEYASASLEQDNVRFYMCDLDPKNFGYTHYFEAKVTNIDGIIPESELKHKLQQVSCITDADCVHGRLCYSFCDKHRGLCTGDVKHSDLVGICRIVMEYVLYDTPVRIKWNLNHMISKCSGLMYYYNKENNSVVEIQQNVILSDLIEILWNQLKDEPNKWLYKPTKRVY